MFETQQRKKQAWPKCSKHNKERNKHGLNVRNTTKKERSKKQLKQKHQSWHCHFISSSPGKSIFCLLVIFLSFAPQTVCLKQQNLCQVAHLILKRESESTSTPVSNHSNFSPFPNPKYHACGRIDPVDTPPPPPHPPNQISKYPPHPP